jgi:hypothetical protein
LNFSHAKTQYITDEKATGGKRGNAHTGTITVMTFRDKNGGEIKIADANGNSFLESEELFLNEILGGVNIDIGMLLTSSFQLMNHKKPKPSLK